MMRKYFENVTGTASGSDMIMKHGANISLQLSGCKGEGITDDTTWIKKSHYPLTLPFQSVYRQKLAIICSRNPLDVAPSFFQLIATQTHVH